MILLCKTGIKQIKAGSCMNEKKKLADTFNQARVPANAIVLLCINHLPVFCHSIQQN